MNTLLLNPDSWDLLVDINGNIAVAGEPYRLAQDVACAIKTFNNDLWYNKTYGIPYFDSIFGKNPPLSLVADYLQRAVLSVPDVIKAKAIIEDLNRETRVLSGVVLITDANGITNGVRF